MKKIAVIGLGIIGGSICASLTKAGFTVDGTDLNESNVSYAIKNGYIQARAEELSGYDVVFIAIPPAATISVLDTAKFKDGALVSDICGVKEVIEKAVYAKPRNYRYVGMHPMAGKETSGIRSASANLFNKANLVLVHAAQTKEKDVDELKTYAHKMGFGRIVECTAEEHDRKIALTSQLAHIVSNAYVKSAQVKGCDGFTGGSFQDMTRIAGVDEKIWTQLYMHNKSYALEELEGLIEHLNVYCKALREGDEQALSDALKEGRLIRETIKRGND